MAANPSLFDVPAVPALRLARRFDRRNRVRALRVLEPRQRLFLITGAAAALIAVAAVATRLCMAPSWWLDPLRTHPPVVALAAALMARSRVARARRITEGRFATSWLGVTPIEPRDVIAMVRRRALLSSVIVLGIPTGILAATGAVNALAVGRVIVAVLAGGIPGALVGWWSGGRPSRVRAEAGIRIGRLRAARTGTIDLDALGRWAFAERLARLRPRIDARVFGSALLSMPLGIPPLIAILLLLSLVMIVIATTLLNGQLAIIPRAADWLRATPLALRELAIGASARAWLWQGIYALAMAFVLAALGIEPRTILWIAAGWLAWVAVSTITTFALRHRPDRVRMELFLLGALLAGLATIAVPVGLFAAAIIAAVQWKRAEAA